MSKSSKPVENERASALAPSTQSNSAVASAAPSVLNTTRPDGIGGYINGEPVRGMVTDRLEQQYGSTAMATAITMPQVQGMMPVVMQQPLQYAPYVSTVPAPTHVTTMDKRQQHAMDVDGPAPTTFRSSEGGRTMVRIEGLHYEVNATDLEVRSILFTHTSLKRFYIFPNQSKFII